MSRGLNRFAILVACATFFLIIAGALVTSHDAGLATSDWPLSNGQVFPKMVGNLFWEHGHRMVATTVGLLTIVLMIYILRREQRLWVRKLGIFALLAVIAQGLLGGLTVKLMLPLAVSAAHATLAQLFFCTTVSLAVFTSRSWMQAETLPPEEKGSVPLRYLCTAALVTIFLQLIIGATLRHSAPWDKPLPAELVLTHVGGALAVAIALGAAASTTLRRHKGQTFLTRPVSTNHSKRFRPTMSAVKREARMPRVSEIANPLTGPLAFQNNMTAVMSVVTLASKIELKAFS